MGMFESIEKNIIKTKNNLVKNFKKNFKIDFEKPMADIFQNSEEVVITVSLPEIKRKDIVLNIFRDYVEILAEQEKTRDAGAVHSEIHCKYYRKIPISKNLDTKNAKAMFHDKKLTIKIPKTF